MQLVSYYVAPYEPPIPFLRRLEQHVKEALIHKAMESLKRIKINRPLLKEIRQTDDYAKHMKNLVENKLRISEDKDVKMNTRCLAILQNQLPPKEQDPGSFTLPCSIGKLTFNALADLGASISVMPLSMFKVDFVILDMVEDFRIPIILGRPLLDTAHAKEPQDKIDYSKLDQGKPWEIEDDITNMNIDLEISPNTGEDREDLENFRDAKIELILDNVYDKLDDDWFNGTVIDEEDLDGIVDYLELKSYDGFIDVDDKAYKKKRECSTKGRILQIDKLPRTSTNVATIRAELMKEMDAGGSVQREA
ncbi:hypothetical protein Tco_0393481 [Tanacetum coccineum]